MGRLIWVGVGLVPFLLSSSAFAQKPQADRYERLEKAIIAETNLLRAEPSQYAERLRDRLKRYDGDRYVDERGKAMITNEGIYAVLEAIGALVETAPVSTLERTSGLDAAAETHAADQRNGRVGHIGSDGTQPYERVSQHYEWDRVTVENLHYGGRTAQQIIGDLLIDDGVANRGHREALLDDRVQVMGIACGPHKRHGTVCVMEYAVPQQDLVY